MDLNLIGKFSTVFKFVFSSFLSIEMLLISVLLLIILIVNLKQKNRTFQFVALAIYLGFVLGIMISYTTYVKTCIDSFFKAILNYFYFPSTITYFFIIIFVTIMIIYTIFSNKMSFFKKVFNFSCFSIIYYFFMSFISLAAYDGVDISNVSLLYQNNTILSLVQVSNIILFIWIMFTSFYHLLLYYKKKFD